MVPTLSVCTSQAIVCQVPPAEQEQSLGLDYTIPLPVLLQRPAVSAFGLQRATMARLCHTCSAIDVVRDVNVAAAAGEPHGGGRPLGGVWPRAGRTAAERQGADSSHAPQGWQPLLRGPAHHP